MRTDPGRRLSERGALLLALLRREKHGHARDILAWGGLRIVAGLAAGAAALVGLAVLLPVLPRALGLLLGAALWAGAAWLVWRHWVLPLRAVPNLAVFSRLIEERRDFRDMLRAALEWSQRGVPDGQSADLVADTIDRAYEKARSLRLTALFTFAGRRRHAAVLAASTAVVLLAMAMAPGAPGRAASGLAFRWPAPGDVPYGRLEVLSGDRTVLAGEDVVVAVRETGRRAPEVTLRFNDTGDIWKSRALQPVPSGAAREYSFRFAAVRDPFAYRFENGHERTPLHRVTVVQRPIVNRLQLRLVPPAYTGRPATILEEGRGDAVALVGTRVEFEGAASSPLAAAMLVPAASDPGSAVTLPEALAMQVQGRAFRAALVLRADLRYHFVLLDSLGHTNADPVTYQLTAAVDRPPYVELRLPGQDADLPKSLQVPLGIYAADDFGLSRLTLVHRIEKPGAEAEPAWSQRDLGLRGQGSTGVEGRALAAGPVTEVLKSFAWNLADQPLFPGDVVAYYIEVEDNDAFSGRKTARTPIYKLRLPTLGELYAEMQQQDENRMQQLDDALEKGRQLREKYEKLARELKKSPEMDWKKEKEVESALEKQRQLAEQVQKIADELVEEVQKMQQQQLLSDEIARKMDEIRKLMEEVEDDTLREYMQRLQEAMQQISPEEIQRAMEQMQMSQEEFLKRLERTKALLEQLRREQRLDSLVERVGEVLRQQEQLGDRTEALEDKEKKAEGGERTQDGSKPQELAREQEELADRTSELQQELDGLAQEMQEAGQDQLQDANQQMQEDNPANEMQDASRQLRQQQPRQAQPHQQQAEKSLRALYQQLMQAQQAMSMQAQQEAAAALAKAARQALDVSFRQESLTKKDAAPGDFKTHGDLAQRQQSLRAATGKVAHDLDALAQKSLAAPPQVTGMLGQAMQHMREGATAYEKGNAIGARVQGEEAYGLLNRIVVELNRSASASCQSPGGGQTSGQRLQQLMGQQMQLNDATRQLQQAIPNPQNLSPEERAQMSRLLGEQRSIESELQDIERQAAEKRDLLGRLDKMQDEMREVIEDMASEAISDETLRAQERIVSRMLDAQRSLHKRDYNEERESRSAAEIYSQGGKPLPESEKMKKLRRDIERALREGTPEEYEDLVRQYFRAIGEAEAGPAPVP